VPVGKRVVDHFKIARLEDIERHLSTRQQQRARQRKDRNDFRKIRRPSIDRIHRHRFASARHHRSGYENRIEDRRRRPETVASSVGPQASKNCTSCLRAPSSFHLRSRLTISIR
jgi:hypothetical protein